MPDKREDAFSEERERNCRETGGWTIATLREDLLTLVRANDLRYEQRFTAITEQVFAAIAAQKESVNTAMQAAERALTKAESASEKRFDAVNEFRATLADQQRNLMPRAEAEVTMKGLDAKIDSLSKIVTSNAGVEKGAVQGWSIAIAAVSTFIAIAIALFSIFRKG